MALVVRREAPGRSIWQRFQQRGPDYPDLSNEKWIVDCNQSIDWVLDNTVTITVPALDYERRVVGADSGRAIISS